MFISNPAAVSSQLQCFNNETWPCVLCGGVQVNNLAPDMVSRHPGVAMSRHCKETLAPPPPPFSLESALMGNVCKPSLLPLLCPALILVTAA